MEATRTDTKKNEMKYEKSELELMTTYQLREICRREKIMNGVIHPLDKEELIQTIMRYMGKRLLSSYLLAKRCLIKTEPALFLPVSLHFQRKYKAHWHNPC